MKVSVKRDEEYAKEFLTDLGRDIDQGVKNFISEQRTHLFRMHTDLDILESQFEERDNYDYADEKVIQETLERLWPWFLEMQYVMCEFFANTPEYKEKNSVKYTYLSRMAFAKLGAVVCLAPSKVVEKDKTVYLKTGVHIIWPFIVVDSHLALMIRKAWIQHFEKKFGERQDKNNIWEDVFDSSIYLTNGLRMVGSDKMEVCPSCKKKKAPDLICRIGLCDGKEGQYPADRPYKVCAAMKPSGRFYNELFSEAQQSGLSQLQFTCIRQYNIKKVTPWIAPKWFDMVCFLDEAEKHKERFHPTPAQRQLKRKMILDSKTPTLTEDMRPLIRIDADKVRYMPEHEKCQLVQEWIKSDRTKLPPDMVLPEIYRKVEIIDMTEFKGTNGHPYYIVRVDSYFCLNKADEHSSSSIYFLINPNGLYQKCYCQKETKEGRKFGPCKKYKSSVYKMPTKVREKLFPVTQAHFMQLDHAFESGKLATLTEEQARQLLPAKMHDLDIRWEQLKYQEKKDHENRIRSKRT